MSEEKLLEVVIDNYKKHDLEIKNKILELIQRQDEGKDLTSRDTVGKIINGGALILSGLSGIGPAYNAMDYLKAHDFIPFFYETMGGLAGFNPALQGIITAKFLNMNRSDNDRKIFLQTIKEFFWSQRLDIPNNVKFLELFFNMLSVACLLWTGSSYYTLATRKISDSKLLAIFSYVSGWFISSVANIYSGIPILLSLKNNFNNNLFDTNKVREVLNALINSAEYVIKDIEKNPTEQKFLSMILLNKELTSLKNGNNIEILNQQMIKLSKFLIRNGRTNISLQASDCYLSGLPKLLKNISKSAVLALFLYGNEALAGQTTEAEEGSTIFNVALLCALFGDFFLNLDTLNTFFNGIESFVLRLKQAPDFCLRLSLYIVTSILSCCVTFASMAQADANPIYGEQGFDNPWFVAQYLAQLFVVLVFFRASTFELVDPLLHGGVVAAIESDIVQNESSKALVAIDLSIYQHALFVISPDIRNILVGIRCNVDIISQDYATEVFNAVFHKPVQTNKLEDVFYECAEERQEEDVFFDCEEGEESKKVPKKLTIISDRDVNIEQNCCERVTNSLCNGVSSLGSYCCSFFYTKNHQNDAIPQDGSLIVDVGVSVRPLLPHS